MKATTRLTCVLVISFCFFIVELAVGFKTRSLALLSDAFHYLNDIIAYVTALTAAYLQENGKRSNRFSFAFQRAELVGAFFNGVFLLALALSIFLQSIERFLNPEEVSEPLLVIIIGAIGLVLNIVSAIFAHDHSHGHSHSHGDDETDETGNLLSNNKDLVRTTCGDHVDTHAACYHDDWDEEVDIHELHNHTRLPPPTGLHGNLGLFGVFLHVVGDAINNIGVMISGALILNLHSKDRFYADPAISMAIALMIFASAIPLTKRAGIILLEATPDHLNAQHIIEDLTQLPGVEEVKDLHVWHLSQSLICASLSIVTPAVTLEEWARIEASIRHCFDEFGISHVVVAPYRREQVAAAMAAAAELRRKQQQNGEEQDAEAEAENAEAAQEAEGGATPPAAAP